jgi:Zn-dependent protease with chaperone function
MNRMGRVRATHAALGLALILGCSSAPAQPSAGGAGLAGAVVSLVPNLRGDVEVTVEGIPIPGSRLAEIAGGALDCDWQSRQSGAAFASGICHRLLKSDGLMVEDWLVLAPLATALRQDGAVDVQFNLQASGRPMAADGPQWHRQSDSSEPAGDSHYFLSASDRELPPPFAIRMGSPWQPVRMAGPFLLVFFGPALLAWRLRRVLARTRTPGSGLVWLNWVLPASWLYWLTAIDIRDAAALAAHLGVDDPVAIFVMAAAFFSLPLLAAMVLCLLVLVPPPPAGEPSHGETARLLRRSLACEGVVLVPLALLAAGAGLMRQDAGVLCFGVVAALAAYQAFSRLAKRWRFAGLRVLRAGDLRNRAAAIARAAGVNLKNVYLSGGRALREANVIALSGGNLVVTRSLLAHFSRREVEALVAHELSRLRANHMAARSSAFWISLLVAGPVWNSYRQQLALPAWVQTLPIVPIFFLLLVARMSRHRESQADARTVRSTRDPEALMAALARLSAAMRVPFDQGGVDRSVLSHPSLRNRLLTLARRWGVPEARALAILADPNLLARDPWAPAPMALNGDRSRAPGLQAAAGA